MRTRRDLDANYWAVFTDEHRTMRWRIDPSRPITALLHPEVMDISLGEKCFANCPYCYTSATMEGRNYENVVDIARNYFAGVPEARRPFQVAIGGGGEPTLHPEFIDLLRLVAGFGIVPNYTTNGMHLSGKILEATIEFCGGVAVSYHPHIESVFRKAVERLSNLNILTNAHVIIATEEDVEVAWHIRVDNPELENVVLLPYQAAGRGKELDTSIAFRKALELAANETGYALGALFMPYMNEKDRATFSVYQHEFYSGYLMLDRPNPTLRVSSYDLRSRNEVLFGD